MGRGSDLRLLLKKQDLLIIPGVYDSLSARIADIQGFNVVSITGYGIEASVLGKPDIGLATMTTVVNHAKYIVQNKNR